MERRAVFFGLLAAALVSMPDMADARPKRRSRRRVRGFAGGIHGREATDTGECPCNGGKVCTGTRGGRYCIGVIILDVPNGGT